MCLFELELVELLMLSVCLFELELVELLVLELELLEPVQLLVL